MTAMYMLVDMDLEKFFDTVCQSKLIEVMSRTIKDGILVMAVAASIDALAVGISFAFLQVNIVPAVCLIGGTTLVMSLAFGGFPVFPGRHAGILPENFTEITRIVIACHGADFHDFAV